MRDGEAETFGQEGQPADGRRRLELPRLLAFVFSAGLHERSLAGRPGDRAVRPERDLVDPSALRIGGERLAFALGIGRDQLAVVTAGDDALAVGRCGKNGAAMGVDAPWLAVAAGEHNCFLGQHESRGLAEKMRGDNGAVRRHLVGAVDDGRAVVGSRIGHCRTKATRCSFQNPR